jgi:probable F420-dependent oxidoreductase
MDFGVFLPVSGRASSRGGLMHAAQTAEELGFTTVWAADRIVVPWTIDTPYAYNWTGSFFVPPEASFLEALPVLAFLAGCTERLKLGVSVLVTPYRDPLYWAKIATSIDQLSQGRLVLGLGVGWMAEEFRALGREHLFKVRGKVADEQIAVLRNVLTEEHCSFHGDFYEYDDIAFQPKSYDDSRPLQIWIGGEAKVAQRRAGRFGDSWFPYFPRITPQDLRAKYDEVRRTADEAGRDPDAVRLNRPRGRPGARPVARDGRAGRRRARGLSRHRRRAHRAAVPRRSLSRARRADAQAVAGGHRARPARLTLGRHRRVTRLHRTGSPSRFPAGARR